MSGRAEDKGRAHLVFDTEQVNPEFQIKSFDSIGSAHSFSVFVRNYVRN